MHGLPNEVNNLPITESILADVAQHLLSLTKLKNPGEAAMKLTPPHEGNRSRSTIQYLLSFETMDKRLEIIANTKAIHAAFLHIFRILLHHGGRLQFSSTYYYQVLTHV
ncbi:uncharacterized protein EAF01_001448 [Botrytis porri]|uniref:uncharacterized protein n=1 Tax=Botrytis porri TaxID=87229 RepID=UPI0018FFB76C|nr:uncharacterized protein EAF01_001448 [Botrytis porri]KAF7912427.1 hypothetical protein EAF01_001448 [Botrytis porri]